MTSRRLAHAILLVVLSGTASARQLEVHQWLVTVMDDDHNPVTGLGSEDFSLKDGGARQPVVASEPATGPLTVAALLVGFGPETQQDLQNALTTLERAVTAARRPTHLVVLADRALGRADSPLGPRAYVVVPPSSVSTRLSLAALVTSATSTLADSGSDRRAIVAFVHLPLTDPGLSSEVLGRLEETRTPFWTVELRGSGRGAGAAGEDVLETAVAVGGGWRWPVGQASALAAGAEHVGALIGTGQYLVTASVPLLLNGPLPLATRHDRGIVLVPTWSR